MNEEWFTVAEIAARLKVGEPTIRAWLRSKRLRGHNFGGKMGYRVRATDLEEFLATLVDDQPTDKGKAAA
jgi:excisionase family DNA binding protein